MKHRILVLAGTAEARRLCARLARISDLEVVASFAGIVEIGAKYPVPTRVGGFGGADGLAQYVRENSIDLIVDATHPFADQISSNASHAAEVTESPYVRLERPRWEMSEGGEWVEADSLEELFGLLPSRVTAFAPLGSGVFRAHNLAMIASRSDAQFVLRSILGPSGPLPSNIAEVILQRPPFTLESEMATLRRIGAECLVCKNSGGAVGMPKIYAARQLGIPIFLLARPTAGPLPLNGSLFQDSEAAAAAIISLLKIMPAVEISDI